jgi:hypothetical protein
MNTTLKTNASPSGIETVSGMREAYMLPHTSHWEVWDYEEDYEAQPGDWDYEEDYDDEPGDWFHVDGGDIKGNGYE